MAVRLFASAALNSGDRSSGVALGRGCRGRARSTCGYGLVHRSPLFCHRGAVNRFCRFCRFSAGGWPCLTRYLLLQASRRAFVAGSRQPTE